MHEADAGGDRATAALGAELWCHFDDCRYRDHAPSGIVLRLQMLHGTPRSSRRTTSEIVTPAAAFRGLSALSSAARLLIVTKPDPFAVQL